MTTTIINNDALTALKTIDTDSIDVVATDPPYGYSFMNKDWDKAVIGVEVWKEVLRVLKPGAFAAIMSSPRQDVLSRMIANLQDAGFRTDFTSIYWTYASGFPKAANVSKLVDKRNERHPDYFKAFALYLKQKRLEKGLTMTQLGEYFKTAPERINHGGCVTNWEKAYNVPTMEQYKTLTKELDLDNRFDELIEREEAEREIIHKQVMTFGIGGNSKRHGQYKIIDKSATQKAKELDGSYAGFQPKPAVEVILMVMKPLTEKTFVDQALANGKGITWLDNCKLNQRFPANLLVSDSVLKDHSKYFDLDKWFDTIFPFIITPKASSSEKNKGLDSYITVKLLKAEMDNDVLRCQEGITAVVQLLERVMSDMEAVSFSIDESGENITVLFPKDSLSIISTKINKIIESRILSLLTHSHISDYIQDVNLLMENGGSHAVNAESLRRLVLTTIKGKTELVLGVSNAALRMLLKISGKDEHQNHKNSHATVKPLKLMSYLITLLSREQDTILDPFCGSGTTLLAAKMLNRKYLGIELNPEYVDIANKRLMSVL